MNLPIENGLYAPNIQPVKTHQKKNCKSNFITPSYACLQREAKAIGEQLTFLPPAPFSPLWPQENTLAIAALRLFLAGKKVDTPDFQKITHSWRLSAVVLTLRKLGWPIETIERRCPTAERPHRFIGVYLLPSRYIKDALLQIRGQA